MLNSDNYFAINIKKSETARRDICRGLALAENPFRLLIIAIGCIADMSGDGTFFSSCQQSLENIYGAGLEDLQYIEHRVSELEQSINKLERCLDTCNDNVWERLQFALRLQRNELEQLVRALLNHTNFNPPPYRKSHPIGRPMKGIGKFYTQGNFHFFEEYFSKAL